MFEPLHCLNFGISGDQTQNVLWRCLNGELDSISPQVSLLSALIVMIRLAYRLPPPNSHRINPLSVGRLDFMFPRVSLIFFPAAAITS